MSTASQIVDYINAHGLDMGNYDHILQARQAIEAGYQDPRGAQVQSAQVDTRTPANIVQTIDENGLPIWLNQDTNERGATREQVDGSALTWAPEQRARLTALWGTTDQNQQSMTDAQMLAAIKGSGYRNVEDAVKYADKGHNPFTQYWEQAPTGNFLDDLKAALPGIAMVVGAGALGGAFAGGVGGAAAGAGEAAAADLGFWEAGMSGGAPAGATGGAGSLGFYGGDYVNTATQALADIGGGGQVTLPGADQGFWETGSPTTAAGEPIPGATGMSGGSEWGAMGTPSAGGASSGGFYNDVLTGGPNYTNTAGKPPIPEPTSVTEGATPPPAAPPGTGGSALDKLLSGATLSAGDLGSLLKSALNIGSGLYGLDQAMDIGDIGAEISASPGGVAARGASINLSDPAIAGAMGGKIDYAGVDPRFAAMGREAIAGADPWSASGGRALADQQLQAFMRDPSQTAMTDPAMLLRTQGAQRAMGQYGQGSGAMAVAGAKASTDWYDNRLKQLAELESMGNPAAAQQVGLGYNQLGMTDAQTALDAQKAQSTLGVQQGTLALAGQKTAADVALEQGRQGLQGSQLDLQAKVAKAALAGQSLASIAYGGATAGGGTNTARSYIDYLIQQKLLPAGYGGTA